MEAIQLGSEDIKTLLVTRKEKKIKESLILSLDGLHLTMKSFLLFSNPLTLNTACNVSVHQHY